jgi:hypothetical protein
MISFNNVRRINDGRTGLVSGAQEVPATSPDSAVAVSLNGAIREVRPGKILSRVFAKLHQDQSGHIDLEAFNPRRLTELVISVRYLGYGVAIEEGVFKGPKAIHLGSIGEVGDDERSVNATKMIKTLSSLDRGALKSVILEDGIFAKSSSIQALRLLLVALPRMLENKKEKGSLSEIREAIRYCKLGSTESKIGEYKLTATIRPANFLERTSIAIHNIKSRLTNKKPMELMEQDVDGKRTRLVAELELSSGNRRDSTKEINWPGALGSALRYGSTFIAAVAFGQSLISTAAVSAAAVTLYSALLYLNQKLAEHHYKSPRA